MNAIQMLVVGALVALMVQMVLVAGGTEITYLQALVAVLTLKALALFLVPEKPPIIMVKSRTEIEEDE